ncbi:MFS transporter [Flavobacteriaceae bacterium]|jgi:ACS family hexuronate transporter-like MFS transporter|nr:MFS transporter [Flavobacteriaceae bacterium]MBT6377872.1 MFS transporter [Flavobacterium sp.]MDA7716686.1 MFS transporter [Flavobacteriaceae bacterium]MDA9241131.1 MFS transporter [Flavobacteriaceae bacterium]MDA9318134.1 MFS transporter [Flavobacteriaceae bacterium]|tara:strand:+ start:59 stop:1327 length:1269 start_codon:yes stop_codon:yes gene_type:complete
MKINGLRWWIIFLVCIATIINYIDRSALGIMWPAMSEDLGLTKEDYAWIINIFTITYAAGKFISGKIYDKVGTKIGFVLSIFFWSLASVLHFFAKGAASLGIFRGLLGVSEAGNWPGAVKNNAEWFPVKERGLAQGIFNSGAAIGSIVAAPLVSQLFEAYDWRWTFVIIGVLGFLWIIPWLIFNKTKPNNHPWITEEERKYILEDNSQDLITNEDTKSLSVIEILSIKEAWGAISARFFIEPIWWLFVFWMPIYLADQYGFNVKEIGLYAWFPYVGAMIGSLGGGWYVKHLMEKNSLDRSRKKVITIGAIIIFVGIICAILFADTPEKFVSFVFVVLFGFQFSISNIQTIPSDLLNDKSVGTLAGLGGSIGAVSVIIMNWLIPIITVDSYTPAFIILAILAPLSVLSVTILIKEIKPIQIDK